ncbi:MAG: hypothetical protein LBM19_01265 [Holosporales bacterium]|jgi:4-diphosphocytidyl-2-C-methyl-D-erythritol kinase|nr:hypothetical protein [Holosporales bacterium]
MTRIITHAVAKVNLMLNIIGKTADGYHEIESVFVFLPDIFDVLEFDTEREFDETAGNIPEVPACDNSIKKAAKILRNNFNEPLPHVSLNKSLPIAGGVGGGSSDAACFVNTIFDIWGFAQDEKLKYLDAFTELGTDARIFLFKYFTNSDALYFCGGLKGITKPIDLGLNNCYVLLVNNGSKISTKLVYEKFKEPFLNKIGSENINFDLLKNFSNSLQNAAVSLENSLKQILCDIESTKPIFCGVSGSGTTCFGFYDNFEILKSAANALNYKFVKTTGLA